MKTINPNNFGNNITVEQCPKIAINSLLREVRTELKCFILKSKLEAMGVEIELSSSPTRFNGLRLWFKCPICKLRVGVLFLHPVNELLACRLCLGIDYKARRFKGMLEQNLVNSDKSKL